MKTHYASIVGIGDGLVVIVAAEQPDLRGTVLGSHLAEIAEIALVAGQDIIERSEVIGGYLTRRMFDRHVVLFAGCYGASWQTRVMSVGFGQNEHRDAPLVRVLSNMIPCGTSAIDVNIDSPFFRNMPEDCLAHRGSTNVAQAHDEHRYLLRHLTESVHSSLRVFCFKRSSKKSIRRDRMSGVNGG
jgi:hypothetical protein